MAEVIVFKNTNDGVSVITPVVSSGFTVHEIAEKDVPKECTPYYIIDDSELPSRDTRDRWVLVNGQVLVDQNLPVITPQPDPKSFYEKATGVYGDTLPLALVFSSLFRRSLDKTQDTSSLVAALLYFNSCLNNNDWTKQSAKESYRKAYDSLKSFLSDGQITIVDAENIAFNLV